MLFQVHPETVGVQAKFLRHLCHGHSTLFQPGDGIGVFDGGRRIVSPHLRPVHGLAFLVGDAFPLADQVLVLGLQVFVEAFYRHICLFGYLAGGHGCGTVQVQGFRILLRYLGGGGMKRSAPRYLSLALPPHSLFAYLDAIVYQLLVVEYQVLLQPGIGYVAPLGGFLYRDIAVGTQKLDRLGILLLAPRACAAWQTVIQTQALPCPFPKLQHFGIMCPQLAAEIRTAQSELTGDFRYVALDIFYAVARCDSLLVFGMGRRQLSPPLVQIDAFCFFRAAFDTVAFQHQMAMVGTYITGKSVDGNPTPSAYLYIGEVGGCVQLQSRAVFRFRLQSNSPGTVAWTIFVIENVHSNILFYVMSY